MHALIVFALFRQLSRCKPSKVSGLDLGVYLLQQLSVLGIYRLDKRDKSNGSTKRIVIGLCSTGF